MSQIRTIEQTAKRWKLLQAIGVLGLMASALAFFAAPGLAEEPAGILRWKTLGLMAAVPSFIAWAAGRLGGWWYHG